MVKRKSQANQEARSNLKEYKNPSKPKQVWGTRIHISPFCVWSHPSESPKEYAEIYGE